MKFDLVQSGVQTMGNMLHATMLDDVACNMFRSFERAFKV